MDNLGILSEDNNTTGESPFSSPRGGGQIEQEIQEEPELQVLTSELK